MRNKTKVFYKRGNLWHSRGGYRRMWMCDQRLRDIFYINRNCKKIYLEVSDQPLRSCYKYRILYNERLYEYKIHLEDGRRCIISMNLAKFLNDYKYARVLLEVGD